MFKGTLKLYRQTVFAIILYQFWVKLQLSHNAVDVIVEDLNEVLIRISEEPAGPIANTRNMLTNGCDIIKRIFAKRFRH